MATNYTANYRLCQWEPEDNFLREEFNQDNAKIDAALAGLESRKADGTATDGALEELRAAVGTKADSAELNSALEELRATDATKADSSSVDSQVAALEARIAALENRVDVATGTYTGNGAASRYISVGFAPRAVLVEHDYGCRAPGAADNLRGGLALSGSPLYGAANGWTVNAVRIYGSGFYVSGETGSNMNYPEQKYHYLVFR